MLVDLAAGCAVEATCESLSDSYCPGNLTTPGCTRGFVAASFVKPPVSVTVQLKAEAHVERVVILPRAHSSHRPAVLGISGVRGVRADPWTTFSERACGGDALHTRTAHRTPHKHTSPSPHDDPVGTESSRVDGVGGGAVDGWVVVLERFAQRHPPTHPSVAPSKLTLANPRIHCVRRPVGAISAIRIDVARTGGSSTPSLGRVLVIGEPVERGEAERVRMRAEAGSEGAGGVARASHAPASGFGGASILGESESEDEEGTEARVDSRGGTAGEDGTRKDRHQRKRRGSSLHGGRGRDREGVGSAEGGNPTETANDTAGEPPAVPRRFVDPFTEEMMKVPVILPSRNRIDASSLARHLGVSMTDPFTGVAITDADVIIDLQLQAEIAAYSTRHPERTDTPTATLAATHTDTPRAGSRHKRARAAGHKGGGGFATAGYRLGTALRTTEMLDNSGASQDNGT